MPVPPSQTCANCEYMDLYGPVRFYGRQMTDHDGVQIGYCRENSPVPRNFAQTGVYDTVRKGDILGVEWPEVRADDWCGRWKQATPQEGG